MSQRYTIIDAEVAATEPHRLPEWPGVYLLLDRPPFPASSQLRVAELAHEPRLKGRRVLYVGCSAHSLRRRILSHLLGNSMKSTLRMSMGALLKTQLGLQPRVFPGKTHYGFAGGGETTLSKWIQSNTEMAFIEASSPLSLELELIDQYAPPLNICFRRDQASSRQLLELRASISARWPV